MSNSRSSSRINKKDLTERLAKRADIPKVRAAEYIDMLTCIISDALAEGKKVTISDFGTFNLSEREAFEGYDPKNNVRIHVPRRIVPAFRAGKLLKKMLNQPSIRSCQILSENEIQVTFTKALKLDQEKLLSPDSYDIIFTNGRLCSIEHVKSSQGVEDDSKGPQSQVRSATGTNQIVLVVRELVAEEFLVKISAPLQDVDDNELDVPSIWSSSSST